MQAKLRELQQVEAKQGRQNAYTLIILQLPSYRCSLTLINSLS